MRELHKLYVKHACREYLENWPELVKYCGYREDNIPQLQDVNTFLKRKFGLIKTFSTIGTCFLLK